MPFNDVEKKNFGLWANTGWVIDTEGEKRADVQFVSEGAMPRIFVRRDAQLSFTLNSLLPDTGGLDTLRRLDMALVGAAAIFPHAIGVSQKDPVKHFYLPHCGANGITNVPGYNRIVYQGIYPNIDLWVFSGALGQKVMFVVWPGGDPDDIVLEFTGQNDLLVDVEGWLRMQLGDNWIGLPQLMAYQFDQSEVIEPLLWTAEYEPVGNSGIVNLEYDAYDPLKPLVLLAGPMAMGGQSYEEEGLCWSTYVGDDGDDVSNAIRTDADGNIFMAGHTSSTLVQFPVQPGLLYAASGNTVAFVSRFTNTFQPSWSAFIGGVVLSSNSTALALTIDEGSPQRVIIGGQTNAQSFYTFPQGDAYIDQSNSSITFKGFIAEFTGGEVPVGGVLVWSTYFGESNLLVHGMDVHPSTGHLVICGEGMDDLPEVQYGPPPGALDEQFGGGSWDAFIAFFDEDRQLYVSSWFGGSNSERASVVRAGSAGFYVAGNTGSADIDMYDPGGGAYTQPFAGETDCFVIELNATGGVEWSCYLGGPGFDYVGPNGLFVGPDRDIFLCGMAAFGGNTGFPFVPGPNWWDNDPYEDQNGWGNDGFIARFRGSDRQELWITLLGGGNPHLCSSIVQDSDRNIWVAGHTAVGELPYTPAAGWYDQATLEEALKGSFLVRFSNEQDLEHATWFGGDEMTENTQINALAPYTGGVFATGWVSKFANAPMSYWPLDDGGGIPWFDGEYNSSNITSKVSDAFLTFFCSELTTSVGQLPPDATAGLVLAHGDDLVHVLGLPDGSHPYILYDAAGRAIARGNLNSVSQRSNAISIDRLGKGLYILSVLGTSNLKFIRW